MSAKPLKERVEALEKELKSLKAKVAANEVPTVPWWDRVAGTFADDAIYEEAMRLGREWRESFRPKPSKRKKR
jgi:hypothetical protein